MAPVNILPILPSRPQITIVDVGAMSVNGESPPFASLVDLGIASVVGFEPIPEECAKLQAEAKPGHVYLPYAIGDGGTATLRRCSHAMNSSLLEPNQSLIQHFDYLPPLMQVVDRIAVTTRRLDDIPEVAKADFLKIDVQGAELQVLSGGARMLGNVLMVRTEVEFVELYTGQPLFADIDRFMRGQGFCFHTFPYLHGVAFSPMRTNGAAKFSQVQWADALFVRDFRSFEGMQPAKLLKLAVLLHYLNGSYDMALKALICYDRLMDDQVAQRYFDLLRRSAS